MSGICVHARLCVFVCVCVLTYGSVTNFIYIRIYICAFIHSKDEDIYQLNVCVPMCVCVCVCVCMRVYIYTHIPYMANIRTCTYQHTYTYTYMCICMNIIYQDMLDLNLLHLYFLTNFLIYRHQLLIAWWVMTMVSWPLSRDHCLVTIISWPLSHEHYLVTIISWTLSRDRRLVAWQWLLS